MSHGPMSYINMHTWKARLGNIFPGFYWFLIHFSLAVIRRLLLSTLDDPNRKLCTAISMAVVAIAIYDWPESWPDLLPFLLKLIGDQTSMNGGVEKERGCNSTR
ncbi:hypothetical protein ERO13_A06G118000v2 [Gossypium hirsutum]|uniref:Importin-9 isoform X1 n=3 Tax=Gossypium TaxID=3633 RepID=A0A1U8LTR9_GOSHI|nr:importin-9 isoform X1 [Gossypium hirsutum]KAG4195575.1 hypothetical protein ERO13_A06G118000v2 [Gossypium hirsutum]TYI23058.1 hypothetical protein ES332_A06G138900v1 [Gossypium tomentosum]TYJ30403.1 hypothetical protein E1A91_A06G128000v1 [Gossypium mustelinum]